MNEDVKQETYGEAAVREFINRPRFPSWRPLRIAVIGGRGVPSNYSGVERICDDLFAIFAARGHHITVYCRPQTLATKRGEHRGMRLVRTPAPGGKNGETLSHTLTSLLHAVTFGDEGQPFDIISLHTIAPNLFAPIAKLAGITTISHVHGLDHQREKWRGLGASIIRLAEKTMLATADQIVVVSEALREYYSEEFNTETAVLSNGIHAVSDDYTPDDAVLKQWGLERGKYIVTIGRLVPEKRIQDTIEAFAGVDTDMKLVFVGEGKHSPYYEEHVKALGAKDPRNRVVFTGLQTGNALESLFRGAKLYISSSELEGMPASVLECMERHVPAILSDIPPHRALFGTLPKYDLTFKPHDIEGIRGALRRAIADPAHCQDIADSGRRFVRQHYVWPVLAELTERLYLQVAGNTVESAVPQPM